MTYQHILVAHDFSAPSERALEFAFSLARREGSTVDLLHVHPEMYLGDTEPNLGVPWPTPEQSRRYMAFLEQELARLVPPELVGRVRCRVLDGEPKRLIGAEAERTGADLICLGTTGKGGVRRALVGSVSQAVVRQSEIPVMTFP
ncbi:MAG: universal stress protein [Myxococcales bacterium]